MIAYFGEVESNNLGDVAVYNVLRDRYSLGKSIRPLPIGRELMEYLLQGRLTRYSSVMIGGGTQFTGINAEYLKALVQCNDRIWSFGTGVGSCGFCEPPEADLSEIVCFLSRISPLTVRGPLSQDTLSKYDIHSEIIGDPAFGYAKERNSFRGGRKILVNLVSPVDTYEKIAYQSFIANIAASLSVLRSKGWLISFMALGPGDYGYINKFRTAFGFFDSEIAEIYTSVDDFFDALQGSALFLSMRLHGAVLASCAGVPFLLCNYRSKCHDFAALIQQEELLLSPNSSVSDIMYSINYLFSNSHKISSAIRSKALYFRDRQSKFLKKQLCS